ncbi:MAG TPA: ABC transporter permease [Vicinamibacterales bacterium]|jgi:putative ABC transport system permease protein|nr:ABC transporter permease [Vicinamibacterales bacterium]
MTRSPLLLRLYRLAIARLLPPGLTSEQLDDAADTAAKLADNARRRGRRAEYAYWRSEFGSLARTAWMERRTAPSVPDDDLHPSRSTSMFATFMQDVRYALRLLRRTPGFTVVALLTLAIGIGANTAIFSVLNGVLLRPLPFHKPEELFLVLHRQLDNATALNSLTPATFYDIQRAATHLQPMAGCYTVNETITGRGDAERVAGVRSVASVLDVFGVPAMMGRTFTARDDEPGAPAVVVLSHPAWQRLFHSDSSAVGQTLTLNGQPHTVVGVMGPGFQFPDETAEFWAPAQLSTDMRASRTEFFLFIVGRLPSATPRATADAELQTIMAHLRHDFPQANSNFALDMQPLLTALLDNASTRLWILMAAVVCVLLIACANLGNLMMARAADRRREISVRQAIGAGRGRLARQMLTECVVLGCLGGIAGVAVAYGVLGGVKAWLPAGIPRLATASIDTAALLFTCGVSMLAGLAFGLVPAVQVTGNSPAAGLREGQRSVAAPGRVRGVLVVAEIAIAVVLLSGAGLLLRSFIALQRVDPGFPIERMLTFRVGLAGPAYAKTPPRVDFVNRAVERLSSLPGVQAAAAGSGVPVAGRGTGAWFNVIAHPAPPGTTPPGVPYRVITPGYFRAVGIGLLRGRLLTEHDGLDGTPSVVISESTARHYWADASKGDPIGADIYLGAPDNKLFDRATVVGIVRDVKLAGLDSGITEAVYGLNTLMPFWSNFTFVLRTSADPESVAAAARHEIRQLDPTLPITGMRTMTDILGQSVAPARGSMMLLGLLAVVALLMATIGVFGVLSYNVSRRAREVGIRMALGAEPSSVRRLVLRQGLTQAAIGLAIGVAGALWLTRFMSALLFNVSPSDPLTLAGVSALLGLTAAIACYVPARRATRVDPLVVLRAE